MGRSSPHESGFTLVEMLVVLMVVAIAAAIVLPNAVGSRDMDAIAAARTLSVDLQYAQNHAITYQKPVTVTFTPASETYTLTNQSGALNHPITKSAYTVNLAGQEVDLVGANFNNKTVVVFDELGAPDNAGTVTLQAGSYVYRVDVAVATGKISVSQGS